MCIPRGDLITREGGFFYPFYLYFGSLLLHKDSTPNGDILNSTRLSIALRWMAGGCKYDIAPFHYVGTGEVMRSLWHVFDSACNCESLQFKFPSIHEK